MMDDDMRLPTGKTCGDCLHFYHCRRLFNCPGGSASCDWAPSRFALRVEPIEVRALKTKEGE